MREAKKHKPPMVHLNGTCREALIDVREAAYYALLNAYDAIVKIAPNGRDYYPYGPGAIEAAIDHNMSRLRAIQFLIDELSEEIVAIQDQ